MPVGIRAFSLGPAYRDRIFDTDTLVGIPFVFVVPTDATNSTYNIYSSNCPKRLRVIYVHGTMTGAGAAGDTVVVRNNTTAITNTASVAALSDQDVFDMTTINDAQYQVNKGGSLNVVTASAALCELYIHCIWT